MDLPGCSIYLNKKSGDFVLEHEAISKEFGWTTSCGSLVHISNSEMINKGINVVLQSISEFFQREKLEKSELEKLPIAQQKKFERAHKLLGLSLNRQDLLRLTPMHKGNRGGYISTPGEEIHVDLPCSNQEFYQKLMEAFSKC